MNRREFITWTGLALIQFRIMNLSALGTLVNKQTSQDIKMPALFIGHGSPMNAIEQNDFTKTLQTLGTTLPKPRAIICISAHWMTRGTQVNISPNPKMIYDMSGFPDALYRVNYPAPGAPELAASVPNLLKNHSATTEQNWGFDHGNWSIMKHIFPKADIPVFQISIDYSQPLKYHYELAAELKALRNQGVLVIGSGNITHNLSRVDFSGINAPIQDWAQEFDEKIKKLILTHQHQDIIHYEQLGKSALLSVPEPSHFYPLIYTLGLQDEGDAVSFPYEGFQYGTLSMRAVRIG